MSGLADDFLAGIDLDALPRWSSIEELNRLSFQAFRRNNFPVNDESALRGHAVTVLDELYEVAARHNLDVHVTTDKIPAEPIVAANGMLCANWTCGDTHVRIDLPTPV